MTEVPLLLPPPPCATHAKDAATTTCAGCGLFLCAACAAAPAPTPAAPATPEGPAPGARCPTCRGAGHPIPWEDPRLSAGAGLWRTLKLLPRDSFHAGLPWTGGLGLPLRFAAVSATLGALFAALLGLLASFVVVAFLGALRPAVASLPDPDARVLFGALLDGARTMAGPDKALLGFAFALLTPVLTVLEVLVISALTQPVARALGGQGTFEGTLRAVAYAQGALVLKLVPLVGGSIAFLGVILVATLGLRRAHGLTGGRALIAAAWWIPVQLALGAVLAVMILGQLLPHLAR